MEHHLSNVEKMMKNNEWDQDEGVLHFCACHPAANAKLRKRDVENSSFAKIYELHGVPTLVLIDGEGKKMESYFELFCFWKHLAG